MSIDGSLIPVLAMVLGLSGVALPASVFSIARSWSKEQPDQGGAILGGAVAVSLVSILGGILITLVCLDWLPKPENLF